MTINTAPRARLEAEKRLRGYPRVALALPSYVGLASKVIPGANALAYYFAPPLVTHKIFHDFWLHNVSLILLM
jgi:hypothetical protein